MAIKEYDKILYRLTSILTKLSNIEQPTMAELALEYNVSRRTIQRDIYERLNHFPIILNDTKELMFVDGFSLNRTKLSLEEITTLTLSLDIVKNAGDNFFNTSEQLMKKLLYKDFINPYYIKPSEYESIDIDSVLLNNIENSIATANEIEIFYSKTIVIQPIKVINIDGLWYLLARGRDDKKIYNYFISKIQNLKLLSSKFVMDEYLANLHNKILSPFFDDEDCFDVLVEVDKSIADYFKLKKQLSSQKIVEMKENGDLIVSFRVTHEEDIDNIIKSWLPHIKVISPQSFKDKIKKELEDYVKSL
ncbi:MAG: WYL domain-containing protein [Campylobacterota bacterium]|nr:WYL domain-containing protein [Campylobacterota bacterium]